MPSRWLHNTLLDSQRWNDLGHAAQNLYVRLVLVVDDFGCFDGRENVLAAACYPAQRVDVAELLQALHAADMIVRYSNASKPYIALMRWHNDIRGKRRFPAPPICNESIEGLPDLRGKFNRPIGWRNPGSAEPVSILLDAQMRPTVPQPPEWRLVDKDYAPDIAGVQALRTTGTQPLHTMVRKPYTQDVDVDVDLEPEKKKTQTLTLITPPAATPTPAPQHGTQALQTQAPPANGKYELNDNGEWTGVSDAQRARWQEMFSEMSIPDQIERAGAWLVAHPTERKLYTERGELEQYLIRWMLREGRTGPARAGTDSQGKR